MARIIRDNKLPTADRGTRQTLTKQETQEQAARSDTTPDSKILPVQTRTHIVLYLVSL